MKFQSDLLRTERQRKGFTIEGLAAIAGVNWVTVSRAERGVGSPSLDTAVALANALEIPFEALFTANGEEDAA